MLIGLTQQIVVCGDATVGKGRCSFRLRQQRQLKVCFIKMLGEFLLSDCFSDRYAVPIAALPTEGAEPLPYSSAQINNNFSGCCVKPIAHSVLHWAMMVPFIFLWIKFPEQKTSALLVGRAPGVILSEKWENSSTPLESLLAFGAGDGDFALVPGDADGLAAPGADEITVLPVLDPVQHQQEPAVFLVALVDIPGQAAEDGPDHQHIAQHPGQPPSPMLLEESRQDACRHTHTENDHIQPIRTVPAGHKMKEAGPHSCSGIAQPALETIHCHHPGN